MGCWYIVLGASARSATAGEIRSRAGDSTSAITGTRTQAISIDRLIAAGATSRRSTVAFGATKPRLS